MRMTRDEYARRIAKIRKHRGRIARHLAWKPVYADDTRVFAFDSDVAELPVECLAHILDQLSTAMGPSTKILGQITTIGDDRSQMVTFEISRAWDMNHRSLMVQTSPCTIPLAWPEPNYAGDHA